MSVYVLKNSCEALPSSVTLCGGGIAKELMKVKGGHKGGINLVGLPFLQAEPPESSLSMGTHWGSAFEDTVWRQPSWSQVESSYQHPNSVKTLILDFQNCKKTSLHYLSHSVGDTLLWRTEQTGAGNEWIAVSLSYFLPTSVTEMEDPHGRDLHCICELMYLQGQEHACPRWHTPQVSVKGRGVSVCLPWPSLSSDSRSSLSCPDFWFWSHWKPLVRFPRCLTLVLHVFFISISIQRLLLNVLLSSSLDFSCDWHPFSSLSFFMHYLKSQQYANLFLTSITPKGKVT